MATKTKENDDCLACRVVGGGGLIAIAAYVVWGAWKGTNAKRSHRLVATVFASGLASLGVARIGGWRMSYGADDDANNKTGKEEMS